MIANDVELQATQERIAFFYQIVANIRAKARTPEEYRLYSNSYLAEIEKMNAEVLAYLKRYPSEPAPPEAA
jgi:hypothetical protein